MTQESANKHSKNYFLYLFFKLHRSHTLSAVIFGNSSKHSEPLDCTFIEMLRNVQCPHVIILQQRCAQSSNLMFSIISLLNQSLPDHSLIPLLMSSKHPRFPVTILDAKTSWLLLKKLDRLQLLFKFSGATFCTAKTMKARKKISETVKEK